jgi:hypothetical protein
MKQMSTLIFVLSTFSAIGQTKECDCNDPLNKDLTTKFTSTEYRDFKDWLFIYIQSDVTKRTQMKNDKSASFMAKAAAIVDGFPMKGENQTDLKSASEDQTYYRVEQTVLQNKFLTDQQFNLVVSEQMGINQLVGYKACLNLCEKILGNGITANVGGDVNDILFIQVNFNSTSGGEKITLKDNALFSNLEPIGNLVFKDGLVIRDRQSRTQFFKRIDAKKNASFVFNVIENIKVIPLELPGILEANQQATPIGTIVASVLDYSSFLEVNGLKEFNTNDMTKAIWIPCDGRILTVSKYAKFSGGRVPDLRGVFLRGANDYQVIFDNVGVVSDSQKNPENKAAGEFQQDAFRNHTHPFDEAWGFSGAGSNNPPTNGGHASVKTTKESPSGDVETRPKNVTVFYYLKIN